MLTRHSIRVLKMKSLLLFQNSYFIIVLQNCTKGEQPYLRSTIPVTRGNHREIGWHSQITDSVLYRWWISSDFVPNPLEKIPTNHRSLSHIHLSNLYLYFLQNPIWPGETAPKRVKIFAGGYESNEDYTYVRGRGKFLLAEVSFSELCRIVYIKPLDIASEILSSCNKMNNW